MITRTQIMGFVGIALILVLASSMLQAPAYQVSSEFGLRGLGEILVLDWRVQQRYWVY